MQARLLTPEEIAAQAGGEIPFLRLPGRATLFSDRARRLRQLAQGHSMAGYLEFVAQVADAQQAVFDAMPPVMLPRPEAIAQCQEHGMPLVHAQTHQRDRVWCDVLRRILRQLADKSDGKLRGTIVALEGSRDELYEAQASKLVHGITFGLDVATAPLIAAGLQVYWAHLVTTLGNTVFVRTDAPNVCPCCGSHPTASIVRIGGHEAGYRYLHCSLCAAEWHMVRIKCTQCESTKGIKYFGIDPGADSKGALKNPVMLETCDECNHYLKICYMDRDPNVDPCADDLATLALDLLVADEGREPWGVNFMLIHGDPETATTLEQPR